MVGAAEFAQESVDPSQSAIEAYVEATAGGDADPAGFPWAFAIGFLLILAVVFVIAVRVRRLSR